MDYLIKYLISIRERKMRCTMSHLSPLFSSTFVTMDEKLRFCPLTIASKTASIAAHAFYHTPKWQPRCTQEPDPRFETFDLRPVMHKQGFDFFQPYTLFVGTCIVYDYIGISRNEDSAVFMSCFSLLSANFSRTTLIAFSVVLAAFIISSSK